MHAETNVQKDLLKAATMSKGSQPKSSIDILGGWDLGSRGPDIPAQYGILKETLPSKPRTK
jgi:hypothetical protein